MSFSSDLQAFWRSFSLERILMAQRTALVIRILDAFVNFFCLYTMDLHQPVFLDVHEGIYTHD